MHQKEYTAKFMFGSVVLEITFFFNFNFLHNKICDVMKGNESDWEY